MARRFIPCDTWEQAMAMKDLGLLYVNRSSSRPRLAQIELCPPTISTYLNGFRSMEDLEERSGWISGDLYYAVED